MSKDKFTITVELEDGRYCDGCPCRNGEFLGCCQAGFKDAFYGYIMRGGSYVATWKNGDPIEPDQTDYDLVDTSAMLRPQSCIDAARKEEGKDGKD